MYSVLQHSILFPANIFRKGNNQIVGYYIVFYIHIGIGVNINCIYSHNANRFIKALP